MIYISQTILSTNSELYIPSSATIVGSRMSTFTRGSVETHLPNLVYSILPVEDSDRNNSNEDPINQVLSRRNNYSPMGLISNLTKVRVFLIPVSAQNGNFLCTYGVATSNRHTISQYADVTFKNEPCAFYVETLSAGDTVQQPSPTSSNRRNSQQLGPATRNEEGIRIIN